MSATAGGSTKGSATSLATYRGKAVGFVQMKTTTTEALSWKGAGEMGLLQATVFEYFPF